MRENSLRSIQSCKSIDMKPASYISIAAVMKDEGVNLIEWLEFHKIVGIEHFYLYDNGSTDNTREILQPYIESGEVSYFYTDMENCQLPCYHNAFTTFADRTRWMAFIDIDEFLFSSTGDFRRDLGFFEKYSGVVVNWLIFGSNGHIERPDGLVIDSYIRRNKTVDPHVKTICQPAMVDRVWNPHFFSYKQGFAVNENEEVCDSTWNEAATINRFRINHYFSKSRAEAKNKLGRGKADVPRTAQNFRYDIDVDKFCSKNNDIEDTVILRYSRDLNTVVNEVHKMGYLK
jgi:hypothetical protein